MDERRALCCFTCLLAPCIQLLECRQRAMWLRRAMCSAGAAASLVAPTVVPSYCAPKPFFAPPERRPLASQVWTPPWRAVAAAPPPTARPASSSSSAVRPAPSTAASLPPLRSFHEILADALQREENDNPSSSAGTIPKEAATKSWWMTRTWERLQTSSLSRWVEYLRDKHSDLASELERLAPLEIEMPPSAVNWQPRQAALYKWARDPTNLRAVNMNPEQYTHYVCGRPVQVTLTSLI